MILKSFEIENNIKKTDQYKFILIYGENIGLKETRLLKLGPHYYDTIQDAIAKLSANEHINRLNTTGLPIMESIEILETVALTFPSHTLENIGLKDTRRLELELHSNDTIQDAIYKLRAQQSARISQ